MVDTLQEKDEAGARHLGRNIPSFWVPLVWAVQIERTPTRGDGFVTCWRPGQDSPVHQLGPDEVVHVVGKAESHRGRRPPAQEL